MHIVLLMHARLPCRGYGGTERVTVWLARGLAALGHRVTLIAGRGTRLPEARVIEEDVDVLKGPNVDLRRLVPDDADVLHAMRQLPMDVHVPNVWTLHGNPKTGWVPPANTIFLSANHASRYGGRAWVHNGIDPADYRFAATKQAFDLFLGRLHSVKGWRWAVEGTRRAGRRLVIAGAWRPSLRRGLRYVGSVDGARKARLLADAACLWMPAQWDEPFGLTLVEALVSGTPVLGTRRGSLPEIVTPDVGALGDTLDELVTLRSALASLDPEACRRRVLDRFTHLTMAEGYLRYYEAARSDRALPQGRS